VLTLPASVRIYISVDPVDLRRGHDGLSAIVQGQWGMDLFDGHLFVFFGRRRDRCKILFWDRGGLVLYYKRLERGRFRMPKVAVDGRSVQVDATELAMLLDGIDVRSVRRPEHWQPDAKKKAGRNPQGIDISIGL
jgi:transposase